MQYYSLIIDYKYIFNAYEPGTHYKGGELWLTFLL